MGAEDLKKIKVETGKPQKGSLKWLKGTEGEPEPDLEEKSIKSEGEKIIVERVIPQIKTVPPESPPDATEVEGEDVIESRGMPEPEAEKYQMVCDELSGTLLETPVSITVKSTEVLKVALAVLRFLMAKNKMRGVVICGDRPAMEYNKLLKRMELDPEVAYYIDLITLFTGHDPTADEKKPNIAFIHNPADLTALDIALTQAVERLQKETLEGERAFLLFDCLASLQLYSTHTRLGMFVHNLTSKLKIYDVYGVIFLLEENTGSVLSSTIQTFCDRNISI